ncbi:MAG: ABC transporter ATP-binding protein [Phycisphaeraceae bacterium]|nr:ABC transporter ATP-binding protein [Phycisphaeraceae bacterium]
MTPPGSAPGSAPGNPEGEFTLNVTGLTYSYPDGTSALRGISLDIAEGQCVGLVGPNGAGKSTLLWHLNGLLPEEPSRDASCVQVGGLLVIKANLPEIRRRVGLLFQDPNDQLFCPTVAEDVAFGPRQLGLSEDEIARRVTQSLAEVELTGFEHRATHRLSSGEKRRVCLAGVLACDPHILVLDEPTHSLDPQGRRELHRLLRQIKVTRLIATHDLELVVELCPRVIVMDHGVIVADGPTLDILGDEALMLKHRLEKPHILHHRHPHGK